MKQLKLLATFVALTSVLLTGCQKEQDSAVAPFSAKQNVQLATASLARLRQLRASLPAGTEEKLKQPSALLLKTDPQFRDMARRALAVEPSACDANTALNQWLGHELSDWNAEVFGYVRDFAMLDLPAYDALVFENSSAAQSFGLNGEYTQRLTKTFKDLRRFWNIQSTGMVLAAMHGSMLQDRAKVVRTYVAVFEVSPKTAEILADIVVELTTLVPQYRGGNHPIFTFNAFSLEGFDFPPYGVIPNKIVMGDGILTAYTGIGYGDVAPQAILAHEFGHQVQFQLGVFGSVTSPEATRRTELMADAYSAYYLSHARGAAMQWKRVQEFLQVFFNIGDCAFTNDGHHGTPTQRMAAAQWAYNLANDAQRQGQILPAQEFTRLFEAQLPQIVAQ